MSEQFIKTRNFFLIHFILWLMLDIIMVSSALYKSAQHVLSSTMDINNQAKRAGSRSFSCGYSQEPILKIP